MYKIFAKTIEDEAIKQIETMYNTPYGGEKAHIRIMPDVHAGAGCTIGTTMKIYDKICPNLVGVDIGCGMYAIKIAEKEIDFKKLQDVIDKYIPSGMEIQSHLMTWNGIKELKADVDIERALYSIGTLGGGNHFIEVDKDDDDNLWIVIHTGSRHLGVDVCKYYQKLAQTSEIGNTIHSVIDQLKAEGRTSEIEATLIQLRKDNRKLPNDLAYVSGDNFYNYLNDMAIVQRYASLNRKTIAAEIIINMGLHKVESFETIHNYIDIHNKILRKGAISAKYGEKIIIPMNMRDGSLICIGKGNEDWNYSAPHGADALCREQKQNRLLNLRIIRSP